MACYGDSFYFYVDDGRTSQEAWTTTVGYGDSFTFLYVYDVRTSREIQLWASAARYGDRFNLLLL
jgi:hypothetical protein